MTTETVEHESLKADTEQTIHTHLDDGNSATDSDADDSAPEPDEQDAELQQAHSEASCINPVGIGNNRSLITVDDTCVLHVNAHTVWYSMGTEALLFILPCSALFK